MSWARLSWRRVRRMRAMVAGGSRSARAIRPHDREPSAVLTRSGHPWVTASHSQPCPDIAGPVRKA
jgi:hypothetical protein